MSLTKKNKIKQNRTKKNRTKTKTKTENRVVIKNKSDKCNKFANSYNTFEEKFDLVYGDIVSSKDFNLEKMVLADLKKAVSPSNFKPNQDYYSYINERWIKDITVDESQKYIVQVDNFRLVQDKVYKELLQIVNDYISTEKTKKAKEIKNLYKSLKKLNTDEQSRGYAKLRLAKIDELRQNKDNIWKMLAFANHNEIISWGSPIQWTINADEKEPQTLRCYVDGPQLSLIDFNIYIDYGKDVEYRKKYRKEYFKYLSILFENALGKNHGFNIDDVFQVEIKLITAMLCEVIKSDKFSRYNKITAHEAKSKYNFDWKAFSKELGFEKTPDFFITSNLDYLKCGTELLLNEWDSDMFRTYWIYIFIRQQQRWNHKGLVNNYNFSEKFVRGQDTPLDTELFPIFSLGFGFNTFLSNSYVDKYQNEQRVNYVKTLAEDLKTVFIRIIKRNKWLEPKTKLKALEKLYKFTLTIGSPKVLREDPLLNYSSNDAWGNMIKMCKWRHDKAVKLDGKGLVDIPVVDWTQSPPKFVGTQSYVVNAMYFPNKNGIYIPLGYIQPPFVDLEERGIEYNLAYIGYTLGHEMSHALDDWGSQYDEYGKLEDWWSEKDKKKYKKIQDDVIKQYETFAAYDGIKFDAAPSVGEDIADISGLTICREYLRDFQIKNEDILPIKKLSFEAFFIYFAIEQRQKISKKALDAQLKTNPHPLDKYRTNVPLSRLEIFRTMYNVKKGDKMWWHSTNRIWE
jgi:putative endopeptidase